MTTAIVIIVALVILSFFVTLALCIAGGNTDEQAEAEWQALNSESCAKDKERGE